MPTMAFRFPRPLKVRFQRWRLNLQRIRGAGGAGLQRTNTRKKTATRCNPKGEVNFRAKFSGLPSRLPSTNETARRQLLRRRVPDRRKCRRNDQHRLDCQRPDRFFGGTLSDDLTADGYHNRKRDCGRGAVMITAAPSITAQLRHLSAIATQQTRAGN